MSPFKLFSPLEVGPYRLNHRVIMAPLTRMRAQQGTVSAHALNVEHYSQRASDGGLIIAEASQISQAGQGYPATPGIHSEQQIEGWRDVTDAVHLKGGRIFLQLWHVGRVSHSSLQPNGALPVAPSAIRINGETMTATWKPAPFETPRALETDEIAGSSKVFGRELKTRSRLGSMASSFMARTVILSSSSYNRVRTSAPITMAVPSKIAADF
jgi:N-ethylmaleimide reductase